ncbi:unnamed protein product, partial [Adineta steineri]
TSYTYFENLSNELLYEIFEYLDACDIYESFSNLNIRLQNLIISPSILLRIQLTSKSTSRVEYRCQHVIIPNSHRIRFLHFHDESLINTFFNHYIIDSSFHRLESIRLHDIKAEKLLTILIYLKSLPRLFSLNITIMDKSSYDLGNIYSLIFSLSSLKHNEVGTFGNKLPNIISHLTNNKFSMIEYMAIHNCYTLNQLNSLLHYTPQLRHLFCHGVIKSDKKFKKNLSMKLLHLKFICFEEVSVSFDEFEVFIKEIFPQLQIFRIGIFRYKNYLDGNRWEQLIKEYMPQLKRFYFSFTQDIKKDMQTNLIDSTDGFINQFNSPFWSERKWFRELKVYRKTMIFSIFPYKKEWIDLHEHMNTDTYSKQNSMEDNYISNREKSDHGIIQFTIEYHEDFDVNWRSIKRLIPTFKAIHFTHLNIEDNGVCINLLLNILRLLPNIESLKFSFMMALPLESSSIEHTRNHLLVSVTNKITKVKLGQVTEEHEIEFFINLFPQIEYLEVHSRFSDERTLYTCLENLSNELLYEIFEYLDAYDIYESFSNLNIRLQNLITSSSLLLRIKLDSESLLEDRCQHVIIPNSHRILSLHFRGHPCGELLIDTFFNHCIIDSSFHRLESILFNDIKTEKLLTTLFYLNALPRLFSLTICINDDDSPDLGNIYQLIFSLPTLKYNRLLTRADDLQITIPHVINPKFSTIEYLAVHYSCTLNQLNSLLYYTPQLRRLSCCPVTESDENFKNDLSISLPHLKFICFEEVSASFDEFEVFIKKISSQLQILKIYTLQNKTYLDGSRWEQLIKEYMPQLKKFYFSFTQDIDDDRMINSKYSTDGFINRFSSPFWSERKWFREIQVYCETMIFLIHPYKKQWANLHEQMNTDTYSKQNSMEDNYIANRKQTDHGIIQLTIEDYEDIGLNGQSIKKLKSSLEAIQFTHLNIHDDTMSINLLLTILRLLPNIESLKLWSIPIVKLESLFIEHTKNHLSVLAINKITKVKLGQVTEEQEIQFFINLCPYVKYLEVGCMSDTDVPLLMKLILMNRMTRIPDLCYLCFIIRMADENMVRTLAKIIDSEIVNDNYTIQRSGNKIIVHWKL